MSAREYSESPWYRKQAQLFSDEAGEQILITPVANQSNICEHFRLTFRVNREDSGNKVEISSCTFHSGVN